MPMLLFVLMLAPQQLTVVVPPATPFTVGFDGPDQAASYRWWCDDAIAKNFGATELARSETPNADGTYTWTATVPGLGEGTHQCFVSAYNVVGEVKSAAIPIQVGTLPVTPVRVHVVIRTGG